MWWTYHLFLFYVLKVPIQTITKPKLHLLILQNSKSKLIQYWLFPNRNTHQTKNASCMKIYVVKHLHWLININGLFVWTFGLEIQAIQLIWKLKNNFFCTLWSSVSWFIGAWVTAGLTQTLASLRSLFFHLGYHISVSLYFLKLIIKKTDTQWQMKLDKYETYHYMYN